MGGNIKIYWTDLYQNFNTWTFNEHSIFFIFN